LRLLAAEAAGKQMAVSSIAIFELWHGVFYSQNPAGNKERLAAFLGSVRTLPFDDHDAEVAGQIVANLAPTTPSSRRRLCVAICFW
jgi:predicted nucleic acid-binding protein